MTVTLGQLLYEVFARQSLAPTAARDWSTVTPDVRQAWEVVAADINERKRADSATLQSTFKLRR